MRVAVGEAGHDEAALGMQDLSSGTDVAGDFRRVSHGEDLAVGDGHRTRPAAARREARPDGATLDHEIGCGTAGGE